MILKIESVGKKVLVAIWIIVSWQTKCWLDHEIVIELKHRLIDSVFYGSNRHEGIRIVGLRHIETCEVGKVVVVLHE